MRDCTGTRRARVGAAITLQYQCFRRFCSTKAKTFKLKIWGTWQSRRSDSEWFDWVVETAALMGFGLNERTDSWSWRISWNQPVHVFLSLRLFGFVSHLYFSSNHQIGSWETNGFGFGFGPRFFLFSLIFSRSKNILLSDYPIYFQINI